MEKISWKRFKEKVVIVTGSGRGIGKATAMLFAREGARVIICDIDGESGGKTANEIQNLGGESAAIQLDVRDPDSVRRVVENTLSKWYHIDILVNNAGITIAKAVVDFEEEEWERMIEINLKGVFRCTQQVARHMIEQGGGKIINIASESGKTAKPLFTIYGATKFGIVGFTQGLAQELAPYGINVNCVCPGIVRTPMWEELDRTLAKLQNLRAGEAMEKRKKSIPLGRLEEPEDVAGVVAFLASDDAAYMTGQSVNVTGGREFH